jgi:hypothetical protein
VPSDKTARWCQLTPLMLRSLVCLHMMISWCRPRFGPAWSGFEWWGLVAHGLVQRFMHEFKMNSHVSALNIRGKNLILHSSKYSNYNNCVLSTEQAVW